MLQFLSSSPGAFIALAALGGLSVGSFLNVVIHRLPIMLERQWREQCSELGAGPGKADARPEPQPRFNLLVPRSHCSHCGHPLSAYENIPLLSYAWLHGCCSACGKPIGARYPLVEASAGLIAGYLAWHFGFTPTVACAMVFAWALIVLTCIDLETRLLPDSVTQPLLWLGLLINSRGLFTDLQSSVLGAAAGYAVLWAVYWAFRLVTGKEGLGHGDFKLLAAIGAWVGWKMLPLIILFASVTGAFVGGALMVFGRHGRSSAIPFGPFLALAGIVALLWGPAITAAYLRSGA